MKYMDLVNEIGPPGSTVVAAIRALHQAVYPEHGALVALDRRFNKNNRYTMVELTKFGRQEFEGYIEAINDLVNVGIDQAS